MAFGHGFPGVGQRHLFDLGSHHGGPPGDHQDCGARLGGRGGQAGPSRDVGQGREAVEGAVKSDEIRLDRLEVGGRENRDRALEDSHEKPGGLEGIEGRHHDFLGRELEVESALRKHAVFELVAARGLGAACPHDLLHLAARGVTDVALGDVSALRESGRDRLLGQEGGHDPVEVRLRDLAAGDKDRPELVLGRVRGREQDASIAEVDGALRGRVFEAQRARGLDPVQIADEEGRLDVADGAFIGEAHCPCLITSKSKSCG